MQTNGDACLSGGGREYQGSLENASIKATEEYSKTGHRAISPFPLSVYFIAFASGSQLKHFNNRKLAEC
jgi:hypothetical protein